MFDQAWGGWSSAFSLQVPYAKGCMRHELCLPVLLHTSCSLSCMESGGHLSRVWPLHLSQHFLSFLGISLSPQSQPVGLWELGKSGARESLSRQLHYLAMNCPRPGDGFSSQPSTESSSQQEWVSEQWCSVSPEPLCPLQGGSNTLASLAATKGAGELLPRSSRGKLRKDFPSSLHKNGRSLGPGRSARLFPHPKIPACSERE